AITRDINHSHDFAILLAGLSSLDENSKPLSQVDSPLSKDRQWWLPLKRKLNGNDTKYTQPFQAPTFIRDHPALKLTNGTAQQAGMQPDAVSKIDALLQQWANDSDQPFNACIARKGVLFFNRGYGKRNGHPVTPETRHVVYSISKAISGALLMMFVDRELVQLSDPVEKFLPEFKPRGDKQSATIQHLFCHCADLDGHFTDFLNDMEHVYGEAYPYLKIGKQHRYNGTSIGIGCKILEQISGKTLPSLYKEHLFDPLGCESIESIDGSAMTWSNAKDLAIIGQMLANQGSYGNRRFFSPETFKQMLPRKLTPLLGEKTGVYWGIGLTWFREPGFSKTTIGHGSASSCTLRVDLENDLVVTMTRATAGRNFGKYHPQFIKIITDCIAN
ncbi:MAG: serine hydrolase domain-containing protein, partial [Planctomycetota bacterium]|nr:serine hydrolase domain-containing protein [Planctomycetota bacterium]